MQCYSLLFIHCLTLLYKEGTKYIPTAGKPSPTPPSQVDNLFPAREIKALSLSNLPTKGANCQEVIEIQGQ